MLFTGCGRQDRFTFNRNLIKIFQTEHSRTNSVVTEDDALEQNSDRLVLDWKFSTMDKDNDGFLVKAEYRDLRRLVKKVVKPKRCAKTFTKLCALDEQERISREEWASCLGLDFNFSFRLFLSLDSDESHEEAGGMRIRDSVVIKMAKKNIKYIFIHHENFKESGTTLSEQLSEDSSLETREEAETTDCYGDRQAVLEEQRTSNSELYIPECTPDGRYQTIQCYNSTGYCWCVHEDSGKPIPGTSVKDQVPKCGSLPPPARSMNGCPEPNKQIFIAELMAIMKKMMVASTNTTEPRSAAVPKETWQLSPELQVATWNFLVLDKNKNKVLEKKEWKNFRALVSSKPELRRCGKRLPRYCDSNQDRKISLPEWLNCLNTQNNTLTVSAAPSGSRRRGLNPLQIYLKGED
ncbi:hypothetical protein C0J52_13178 [Blattella germanica]|nr:hypothetical protein C0J52_13178 [Blattella germanica]